jgi:hypothetical protein
MLYLVPVLTLSMLGYMAYAIVFRLRRDRIKTERELTRGKAVFRPMHRMQFLLRRSFEPPQDKPDWEQELISSAAKVLPASSPQEPESSRATVAR